MIRSLRDSKKLLKRLKRSINRGFRKLKGDSGERCYLCLSKERR
jgi:hypothetical protein